MENRFAAIPEVTLAYIAGFIDGEGTITIRRSNRGKGWERTEEYGPWVSVAQRDRAILDWVKTTLGCGSVVKHTFKEGSRWGHYNEMHHWSAGYDLAYQLTSALRPHLRIKHRQADILIEFQELKQTFRTRSIGGMKGRLSTPPDMLVRYRELTEQVQRLNGRKVVHTGPRESAKLEVIERYGPDGQEVEIGGVVVWRAPPTVDPWGTLPYLAGQTPS